MITDKRLLRPEPSFGLLIKLWRVSWLYVLLIAALAGVGYAALFSAAGGAPRPYAAPQAVRFAAGLVMMLVLAMTDIRWLARLAWPLYGISIALLALVLKIGHVGKGAERWIDLAGIQMQPSEFAKIALVLVLASYFRNASHKRMGNPLFLIPPAILIAIPVALVLKEPNLGTAVIIALVGASVVFAAASVYGRSPSSPPRCRLPPTSPTATCTTISAPGSRHSSTPSRTRSAPATTSSSPRSRSAPAACGAKASSTARRASSTSCPKNRPTSSSPPSPRSSAWSAALRS